MLCNTDCPCRVTASGHEKSASADPSATLGILVEGESDQLYLSALKNLLISKGKISPLKEIVFIPTGGVKGIKATSAILSGVNEVKPPVLIDGDKPGVKMANELKADFYAADTDKLITQTSHP